MNALRGALVAGVMSFVAARAQAQIVACPAQQDSLIAIPEIRSVDHKLQATLKLVDGVRTLWSIAGDPRCARQNLRLLQGFSMGKNTPWPTGTEPIPGPTFRARLGDLVEISFFNQIDVNKFATSLDKGETGNQSSCDQSMTSDSSMSGIAGPTTTDGMPNCMHGSSTTNVHFHGTHTTPSTTGDNVLLFIRPALRTNGKLRPADEANALDAFASVYRQCEAHGPPTLWSQLPKSWQGTQRSLVKEFDRTAPYQGKTGGLPDAFKLWPVDSAEIEHGGWPQYQIGANPYCFPLPKYDSTTMRMGQAPGTHWYHAHKHGSTALNVANGLAGAFIVAGEYDDSLHAYYGPNFREQVLVIQQLSTVPFTQSAAVPIAINGRRNPVVGMKPGEVQLWRIVNGAFRDAIDFRYFEPKTATSCKTTPSQSASPDWRQIAQDGVQFNTATYDALGTINHAFNLAPGNRADLLVKAPTQPGLYTLCVVRNIALFVQDTAGIGGATPLLTVTVGGASNQTQQFIPDARFPIQPSFLKDIQASEIKLHRDLTFGPVFNMIDGKVFVDHQIEQAMLLNTAEEWTVRNAANDIAHPFHIHVNPFQITALFEPNSPAAKTPGNLCYVNPDDPSTFKPCASSQPRAPYVWWDVFAIPTGQQVDISKRCRPTASSDSVAVAACPAQLRAYTKCDVKAKKCVEYIPGWFKMRSRFVDFAGQFVIHCHILAHEDRGMMQLIEIVSDKSGYSHH